MIYRQKGFTTLAIISIGVVVVVVGFTGYLVFRSSKSASPSAETSISDTADVPNKASTDETSNQSSANSVPAEEYDAVATIGNVKFEIRPKAGGVGTKVEYRLTGVTYDLGDNVQIFLVDSQGYQRSLAAFSITETRVDTVRIPEKVFACELGAQCVNEVSTAKGTGKLIVTHGNDLAEDISIPFEVN